MLPKTQREALQRIVTGTPARGRPTARDGWIRLPRRLEAAGLALAIEGLATRVGTTVSGWEPIFRATGRGRDLAASL